MHYYKCQRETLQNPILNSKGKGQDLEITQDPPTVLSGNTESTGGLWAIDLPAQMC